jgi:hypothetical protein
MDSDREIVISQLKTEYGDKWDGFPERIKEELIKAHIKELAFKRTVERAKMMLKMEFGIDPEAEKKLKARADEIMQMMRKIQNQIAQIQWDMKFLSKEERENKEKELRKLKDRLFKLEEMHNDFYDAYLKMSSIIGSFISIVREENELREMEA